MTIGLSMRTTGVAAQTVARARAMQERIALQLLFRLAVGAVREAERRRTVRPDACSTAMSPLATIGMRFQGDHAVFFAWGSRAGVFAREVAGTAVRQRTTRAALVAVVVDSVNWLNRPTGARFGGVDRPHAIPFCKNAAGPAAGQERASPVETLRDLRPFRSPGWSLVLDCPQKYPVRRQSASALEPTGALRCRSLARPDWYECLEREPVPWRPHAEPAKIASVNARKSSGIGP